LVVRQTAIGLITTLAIGSVRAEEKMPEIGDIFKSPKSYVGKTVKTVVWMHPLFMQPSIQMEGYYCVTVCGTSEKLVQPPEYGNHIALISDMMNLLVPTETATQLLKELAPGKWAKRTVTMKVTQEKFRNPLGVYTIYVGRITAVAK
jgi:hypothetical protein